MSSNVLGSATTTITIALSTSPAPFTPVTIVPAPSGAARTKPKGRSKAEPTLALSPDEFEKENLRVERDACRLKVSLQDGELKDLRDQIKILSIRCELFEKQINEEAFVNLAAPPQNVPLPVPSLSQPPTSHAFIYLASPAGNAPSHLPSSPQPPTTLPSESAFNNIIQLKLLKAVKANSENRLVTELSDALETRLFRKVDKLFLKLVV